MATAYAIAFLQRVSPQSISLSFMHDFSTDAAGVAMLASSYFWGYTLMQIPAGLLVDRYGVKRVVLFSMAASSLGSAAFALAPNLLDVFAARLVVACGDALVFTALLKLVAQKLLRRTVRRDVGHFAGVWLCRRRHRHDTARGRGDRALAGAPASCLSPASAWPISRSPSSR